MASMHENMTRPYWEKASWGLRLRYEGIKRARQTVQWYMTGDRPNG